MTVSQAQFAATCILRFTVVLAGGETMAVKVTANWKVVGGVSCMQGRHWIRCLGFSPYGSLLAIQQNILVPTVAY